ncbi:MAG: hypothetical protein JWO38_5004 [Gemmataceae bacterium]|nr:hypothetical protein [Gemmataceae bacterium]
MYPEFAIPTDLAWPTHPGTVTFIGPDGNERVESADRIPDWLKFAPGSNGTPVPVVRVVRLVSEQGSSLRSYGTDGRLLWVGLTVPAAPSTQPESPAEFPAPPRTARSTRSSLIVRPAVRRPSPVAEPTGWF